MRLTVLRLLEGFALLALIIWAVGAPNEWSLRLLGSTTALLVISALLTAIFSEPGLRAFAIGFLVATCAYLLLAFYADGYCRRYLLTDVTSQVLDGAFKLTVPRRTPAGETVHLLESGNVHVTNARNRTTSMPQDEALAKGLMPYAYGPMSFPSSRHLRDIVHFSWSLIFGVVAGASAAWLARRAERIPLS